jgi:hypothetical protein
MLNFLKLALLRQSCMEMTSDFNKSEIFLRSNGRKCVGAIGKRKAPWVLSWIAQAINEYIERQTLQDDSVSNTPKGDKTILEMRMWQSVVG